MKPPTPKSHSCPGFTLVELLVSMSLTIVLLLILVTVTNQTSATWKYTTGKVEQFREAREAFESMTQRLSQATLNTYWDYDDPGNPTKYVRKSELRFASGNAASLMIGANPTDNPTHAIFFAAPLGYTSEPAVYSGLDNLLNTCGYYIQYGPETNRPPFLTNKAKMRFRLHQYVQPTESLTMYSDPTNWISGASTTSRSIAENIIALVIIPKLSPREDLIGDKLAPDYAYDSTTPGPNGSDKNYNTLNQLPPIVEITMVAVDESTALLLESLNGTSTPNLMDSSWFSGGSNGVASYEADLKALQDKLGSKAKLNYRIFSTEVSIRGAKWSRV